MLGLIIVAVVLLLLVVWFIIVYNRFITLKNAIESTFNQIKVAMKKRLDKISSLVEATKSYIKYEKDVFTQVAKLRSAPMNTTEDMNKAVKGLQGLIGSIKVAVEAYPDLKANENVKKLMDEISNVENEIARLRYLYNDQVQTYNTLGEKIPTNIVAGIAGFSKKAYLEIEEAASKRVKADLY